MIPYVFKPGDGAFPPALTGRDSRMRLKVWSRAAARWRLPVWGLALLATGCGPPAGSAPGASGDATPAVATAPGETWFTDRAAAGIDFVHFNGMSGEYYFQRG